jgi:hypothetical protein
VVVEGLLKWLLGWMMGLLRMVDWLLKWLLNVSNSPHHRNRKRLRTNDVSVIRPQQLLALRPRRSVILVTMSAAIRSKTRSGGGSAEECKDVHDALFFLSFPFSFVMVGWGGGRYVRMGDLFFSKISGENWELDGQRAGRLTGF